MGLASQPSFRTQLYNSMFSAPPKITIQFLTQSPIQQHQHQHQPPLQDTEPGQSKGHKSQHQPPESSKSDSSSSSSSSSSCSGVTYTSILRAPRTKCHRGTRGSEAKGSAVEDEEGSSEEEKLNEEAAPEGSVRERESGGRKCAMGWRCGRK